MKKIMLFGFIVSLFTVSACGIHPRTDGKTGVKIMIDGNFGTASSDQDVYTGEQMFSGSTVLYLSLRVTGSDISPDLIYENLGYILGSEWIVLVPNGTARTFELQLYTYNTDPADATPNVFPIELYKQTQPLTYDLNGSAITLPVTMAKASTTSVGTVQDGSTLVGRLYVDKDGGTLLPQNCITNLEAYLADPLYPGMYLGPVPATILTGGTDLGGEYLISGIPADRTIQLAFYNPNTGWSGISDSFSIVYGTTVYGVLVAGPPYPVEVVLKGWQPFSIQPADILIADSDSAWGHPYGAGIVNAIGGWGNWGSGSFFSQMWSMGNASIMGSTVVAPNAIVYKSINAYGTDVIDNVTVTYQCGAVVDQATFKAHRYLAPWIYGITNILNPNNSGLYIYGDNFEQNGSTVTRISIGASLVPGATVYYAYNPPYYLSSDLLFASTTKLMPLNLPDGLATVKIQNYRNPGTDLTFPSFSGFYGDTVIIIDNTYMPAMRAGKGNTKTLFAQ